MNLKSNPKRWLLYELCPAFYTLGEFDKPKLTKTVYRPLMIKECQGWGLQHIPIGFMIYSFIPHIWVIIAVALIIEIIQTIKGDFLFPLNSLIDILFYVIGGLIRAITL